VYGVGVFVLLVEVFVVENVEEFFVVGVYVDWYCAFVCGDVVVVQFGMCCVGCGI